MSNGRLTATDAFERLWKKAVVAYLSTIPASVWMEWGNNEKPQLGQPFLKSRSESCTS